MAISGRKKRTLAFKDFSVEMTAQEWIDQLQYIGVDVKNTEDMNTTPVDDEALMLHTWNGYEKLEISLEDKYVYIEFDSNGRTHPVCQVGSRTNSGTRWKYTRLKEHIDSINDFFRRRIK